jgi:hypothetical protein
MLTNNLKRQNDEFYTIMSQELRPTNRKSMQHQHQKPIKTGQQAIMLAF